MALKDADVEKLFEEKISGKNQDRPELEAMLNFIREQDEVVVLSLDRLGRNSRDLTDIMDKIRGKGAVLNVLDLPSFKGVDDPALKSLLTNLVIEIYKYTAQHEREQIRERQRQGIKLAKSRGVYKGRVKEYAPNGPDRRKVQVYRQVVKAVKDDVPKAQIARAWGLQPRQIYRIIDTAKEFGDL
jgi:DNA invertase Pin-like site-specific DNA recombinase